MATKYVTGKVTAPDGTAIAGARVVISLSQSAIIPGTQEVVNASVQLRAGSDGTYTTQLQANADLTPLGTFYTFQYFDGAGTVDVLTAVVPQATDGHGHDGSLGSPFVVSYIVTAPLGTPPVNGHVSQLVVDGAATFTGGPISIPAASLPESAVASLTGDLATLTSGVAASALDSAVVHLAGPQTITGVKHGLDFRFAGRPWYDITHVTYGAVSDGKTINDGVMNGTTAVLTSVSALFLAGDVGKAIRVQGAGAAGAMLSTTIASYQAANQVTLTAVSQTAVGAANAGWGTDNTTAIQAAINDASTAGGGIVWVPPSVSGTAYFYSQLVMKSRVWLRGSGKASFLWSITGNTNTYSIILNSTTEIDCCISDLQFHGNKLGQTTANGCLLFDQTGQSGDRLHRLWNLYISNFKSDGLHFTGAARALWLESNYVINCNGHSYVFDANATDNHTVACISGKAGLNGFQDSGANNHFTQCDAFESGQVDAVNNGDGWHFSGANTAQNEGLSSQANLRDGFYISGNYHNMTGLYADSNARDAYRLDGSIYSYIIGTATRNNGVGVGHVSIVNAINAAANCKVEILYEPLGLVSGNSPVIGTAVSGNDIFVNTTIAAWSRERNYRTVALGAIAESTPVTAATTNGVPPTQRLVATAFYFFAGQVITGITIPALIGAAGLTLAQSCLYRQSTSALLANSSDQSAALNGAGTGKFNLALSSAFTILTTGLYYVGFLFVGTTPPSIARNASGGPQNLSPRAGFAAPVVFQLGQATLPAPATFSAGQNGDAYAFEVY